MLFPRQVEHVNGGEPKRDLSRKRRRVRADREVENANPGRGARGVVLDTQRGRILFSVSASGESSGGRRYDVSEVLGEGDVDQPKKAASGATAEAPSGSDPAISGKGSAALGDGETRTGNKDSLSIDPGTRRGDAGTALTGKNAVSGLSTPRKVEQDPRRPIDKDVGEDRVVFRLDGIELVGVGGLEVRMWKFLVE